MNVKFVLVGDVKVGSKSKYKQEIEELVRKIKMDKYVIFIKRIPYKKIHKYYSSFDICVAPYNPNKSPELSKFGFFYSPLKLFECFASGKPVIATNTGTIKDLVTEDRGVLVPVGNQNALAHAIIGLLNDPDKLKRLGRNARAFAETHSWFKHCQEIEKILIETKQG